MMRILVVATTVDMADLSGDSIHLRNLLQRWIDDHEISLVSATAPADCPDGLADSVTVNRSVPLVPETVAGLLSGLAGIAKLRRAGPYDLLYVRHDILGVGTLGTLGAAGKHVLEVNGALVHEHRIRGSLSERAARWLTAYEVWLLSLADQVVCVSPRVEQYVAIRGVDDSIVVENGCDTTQFEPKTGSVAELGLDPPREYVGFVGNLSPWHGLEQLLRAMEAVVERRPQACLLVVGDGPIRERLEQLASELGLADSVRFVGAVEHERVPHYMSAFDVGTILKHPEIPGSPLKLYEYLACGTPVVATDDEDFRLLSAENVGRRVEYDDYRDIADGIVSLLESNEAVGERARTVGRAHSWDRTATEVLAQTT